MITFWELWEKVQEAAESDTSKKIDLAWKNAEVEYKKAEKHLEKKGWNVLSCYGHFMQYHFKIQKDDRIYKVTASEALNIQ